MITSTRREFLKLTASSLALLGGTLAWPISALAENNEKREILLLCDTDVDQSNVADVISVSSPGSVKGLDVANGETFTIDLPFFGHTVTQNPIRPYQAVTFEKWGRHGILLDLASKKSVQEILPVENHIFFGHAAFTNDGSLLAITQDSYNRDEGLLVLHDTSDLKTVRVIKTQGMLPHQCRLLSDQKTFLVANSGRQSLGSSMVWIDWESGHIIHKIGYPTTKPKDFTDLPHGGYAHFDVAQDGWICCGGFMCETAQFDKAHLWATIAFISPQGQTYYPDLRDFFPQGLKGQALSVAVLGTTGLAAFTISNSGNVVLVFDYKTQKLVKHIDTRGCLGVVASKKGETAHDFLVSTPKSLLQEDSTPDVSADPVIYNSVLHGHGSHLERVYV